MEQRRPEDPEDHKYFTKEDQPDFHPDLPDTWAFRDRMDLR